MDQDRIKVKKDIHSVQLNDGRIIEYSWVGTHSKHYKGKTFRGRITTEHYSEHALEGIYMIQVFDGKNTLVRTIRGDKAFRWTQGQLQEIVQATIICLEHKGKPHGADITI